jgi:glycosyltransferase involved in cell wall biosynthesis
MKSNKCKVLVVSGTPPPYSGPEIMTAHLLNSPLQERYNLIHFNISTGRAVSEKGQFDLINMAYGLFQPLQLLWLLMRHRPQVVYTNLAQNLGGFLRYASFILLIALFRTPVVVRVMGDGFNHFYQHSSPVMRLLIRQTLTRIDYYIVRAEALKTQFAGLVPSEKLCVVYSGIDVTEFARPPQPRTDERLRILFVGYLTQAKGAHDLLRALPAVVATEPNVVARLMGERLDIERNVTYVNNPTSNRAVLDQLLAQPVLATHVELLGVLAGQAKVEAFVNADLFVFPSYAEAFPTVVLEAMAAGLPIIATPVGALPEVFDTKSIRFVIPGNVAELAEAILQLLQDPGLRQRMGEYNRQFVQTQFNLDTHAQRVGDLFDRAIRCSS